MLKALIVEDELLARIGLRSLVDWTELGFELLEDAADGLEALERIKSQRPHVILLDLNVPGMGGLDLMREIKRLGIDAKVIIVSCYDDFDTVREALRLGAEDYIRKLSLKREELAAILGTLSLQLKEGSAQQDICASPPLDASDFMRPDVASLLPEAFSQGYCVSVWLHDQAAKNERSLLLSICEQFYKNMGRTCRTASSENSVYMLVAAPQPKTDTVRLLADQIRQLLSVDFSIGIAGPWQGMSGIAAIVSAAATVETAFFYEPGKLVYDLTGSLPWADIIQPPLGRYREDLEMALSRMDEAQCCSILTAMFHRFASDRCYRVGHIRRMALDLLSCFSSQADDMGGSIEEVLVEGGYRHHRSIMRAPTLGHLQEWFLAFTKGYMVTFHTRFRALNSAIISQALAYVEANLHSAIHLGETAKHISVTPQYLSTLFKRELGENFIPYVNRMKMEHAQQMLRQGRLVYEISDTLGFESSAYFGKVFKKYTGFTPESYRKKHISEQ